MRRVLPLDDRESLSGEEVGYKAARLAEMVRLGWPVPPACTVSVDAFKEFCAANDIRIGEIPHKRSVELIRGGFFSRELLDELDESLGTLPAGTLAVRSSAVAEDGESFSMAGQLDTYLNVRREEVPKRIKDCWIGMFGQAVTAYRSRNGIRHAHGMGVIVQRQIDARYAGVLFSLDPVTRSADHLVIEWVEGAGEQLVSGAVTPKTVILERHHPDIPSVVPAELKESLVQLAEYAIRAESHFNNPVDIEWCSDSSGLFLLQVRPITAMGGEDAVVWTNTNMSENFPKPLTPFAWSVVDEFYTRYMLSLAHMLGIRDPHLQRRCSPVNRLTGVQRGRVYYNIKSWYELVYAYLPTFGHTIRNYLDHYIGQNVPIDVGRVSRETRGQRGSAGLLRHLSIWTRLVYFLCRARFHLDRFESLFLEFRCELRRNSHSKLTAGDLVDKLDDLFDGFVAHQWYHQCIADFSVLLFPGILETLVARWVPARFGDRARISAALMQGESVASTESARIIAQIARDMSGHPSLLRLLDEGDYETLELELTASLRRLFEEFLERFGSRCYHECMIVSPTFEERHDLFWDLVNKCRLREDTVRRQEEDAPCNHADLMNDVLRALPVAKRHLFAWFARRAANSIALREQGRLVQSMLFGEIRKLALASGEKLTDLGHLTKADDVFYLQLSEVRDLCGGKFLLPETVPSLIAMRREALDSNTETEPPECFVLDRGEYWKNRTGAASSIEPGTLRGTCAARGKAVGWARIIEDPASDNRLQPGDILVARSTDPGWTPLFLIAGGLVIERGGLLSHAAIVAREFGIPVVIGVAGATRRIPDGALVSLDGDTGTVVALDEEHTALERDAAPKPEEHWEEDACDPRYRASA